LLNRKIGMAYLAGTDTAITKRTWQDVMEDNCQEQNISEVSFHRWNKQFGHMEISEARRFG
jgi:phosphoribulokinase